jgi:hypothetical protein
MFLERNYEQSFGEDPILHDCPESRLTEEVRMRQQNK